MPLVLEQIDRDFLSFDGLEAVTVRPYKATTGGVHVAHALRRAVDYREASNSAGQILLGDTRWHFLVSEHPARPQLGGTIIEDEEDVGSAEWTILDFSLQTLSRRWACQCRNLAVAYGLNATVTRWRMDYSKGRHGEAKPRPVQKETYRARIQWDGAAIDNDHGARVGTKTYTLTLAKPLDEFDMALDRFVGPDGKAYKVTSISNPEQIGELTTISAEVTPWPSA